MSDTEVNTLNTALYTARIQQILDDDSNDEPKELTFTYNKEPTRLTSFLYLGDYADADHLSMLASLGITHLLNCADIPTHRDHDFYIACRKDFVYKDLDAQDRETYDMSQHFEEASAFIDDCRESDGKVLVYCRRGMNRSATICVAYLLKHQGSDLFTTIQDVKRKRGRILTNTAFQEQLLHYAHKLGCLIE